VTVPQRSPKEFAWREPRVAPVTAFEVFVELTRPSYRWWALLAVGLFVGLGTTVPGVWVLLPGFVLAVVVCSQAASTVRQRHREIAAAEEAES
jgi:4-amino-4-deoxy-L-arabinose transferase-like glycosyltransferase